MLNLSAKRETKRHDKNWADPEAKAEAERYDNPIPSRTLILDTLEQLQTPQSHAELVDHFHIQDQKVSKL